MGKTQKKIVVYSATNAHGYFTSLVHRFLYNKDAFAIYVGEKESAKRSGGNDLFDACILFNHIVGPWGKYNNLNAQELEDFLVTYFDAEFKKINVNINEVSDFYIGAYWSDFPIYLNIKGVKHNVFQEANGDMGMLSSADKRFPAKSELQEKYGIFKRLDNPNIINAYISRITAEKIGQHSKIIYFELQEKIKELTQEDKKIFINTFNIPNHFHPNISSILILTNWFTKNDKTWTGIEPIRMYALIADLYSDHMGKTKKIYFKAHPGEPNRDNYEKYLSNIEYFNYQLPSELLEMVPNIHFDTAITVTSTSITSVKNISDKSYFLKYGFTDIYHVMPQVFMSLFLCKKAEMISCHFGIFNEIILPLLECNKMVLVNDSTWVELEGLNIGENVLYIVNDYIWRKDQKHIKLSDFFTLKDSSAALIITDNISNLVQVNEDLDLIRYLHGINLVIKKINLHSAFVNQSKSIYLLTKNEVIKEKIMKISYNDIYPVSGIMVLKHDFSELEDLSLQNYLYAKLALSKAAIGLL